MFDQTFVDNAHETRKPATVAFSLLTQAALVCILAALPLIYTQTLPLAQLKDLIVAPAPPQHLAPAHPIAHAQGKPSARVFAAPRLIAPARIPAGIHAVEEAPAAPDIGPSTGAPTGSGTVLDGLVSIGQAPPPPPPARKEKAPGPVRVGGNVAAANLIYRVQPVYPPLARSARVQGSVEFTAIISKEGRIEHLTLLRGHPLLVNAARDAVSQWRYRPTLLNGQPVEVVTDITVNFTLSQ